MHRNGAFAEYLAMPASNVFLLPDDISDELASIFDPFGNSVHTALSYDLVGEDVLITGAGPTGAMAAAIAKHAGARHVVVTDINPHRLALAKKLGAELAVNVNEQSLTDVMLELGMTEGFDVAMEMSGAPAALDDIIKHMIHGGKIALLGIFPSNASIDWNAVIFKSIEMRGIYGRKIFETWYKMVSMVQSGVDVMPIITHRFAADDFQQAFDVVESGKSGKVILNWE